MATEFLREKLNAVGNLILNEELQFFQQRLIVDAAAKSTGDEQIDKAMKDQATNANATAVASARRLEVYRAKQAELQKELDSVSVQPAAA